MNATAKATPNSQELDALKARLKATWSAGDYDRFSRFMEKDAAEFYRRLELAPGTRLLDVGCGSGQIALIAARSGARVTGCDIAANWIERARERAAAEGLDIAFDVADAESLPYADGAFDAVVSLVGAMFAPRPELVAAELTRVCRPGGLIAMANWTPGGFVGQMFKTIARYIAPSGMPSPVLWGDEATARSRLHEGISDLKFALRTYRFDYPFPPQDVVEFYRENYGPMSRAFASLDESGRKELRRELVEHWSVHNVARNKDKATQVDAEYLEVIATRGVVAAAPQVSNVREIKKQEEKKKVRAVSRRAQLLADRIEEGAAGLAAFAAGLTDEEWRTPVSATDRRTVGVVVHHVASMYPIEIQAAQAVAQGKPVTEVTWEVVAEVNAQHAAEQSEIAKPAALEHLRKNSQEAADAVRSLTDEQLDTAAPFSLSFGAPVTTQFVIEDHALRHSWHHLAKIRKALGR